jgi:hypothetical protein
LSHSTNPFKFLNEHFLYELKKRREGRKEEGRSEDEGERDFGERRKDRKTKRK